jgi:hypothetical protein
MVPSLRPGIPRNHGCPSHGGPPGGMPMDGGIIPAGL